MAEGYEPPDSWNNSREPPDGYRPFVEPYPSISQSGPVNGDYAVHSEQPPPATATSAPPASAARPLWQPGSVLSPRDTVDLFRRAVEKARERMQDSFDGAESIASTMRLNLNVELKNRGIEQLPDEVVQILKGDVERIVLAHNHIESLPSSFAECTTLTYLNLRSNRFREFPRILTRMSKLQVLDISLNQLRSLPDDMKGMKSLRLLSVMHNELQSLPLSLGYLESLRVLKIARNPLNEGLRSLVEASDATASPLATPINENEKEALITIRLKQHLKAEAMAQESGAESSRSDSPLETPRPFKRASLRFPVVPATSSMESLADQRSPGLQNHPAPSRSHFRIPSGPGGSLQATGLRRPGITPLLINSERNRSNSESVLQATVNPRSKRMGMVPKKGSDLSTLVEGHPNRLSHHLRGISHGSVLKEKHNSVVRAKNGHVSSTSTSPIEESHPPGYMRRLSSIPESRIEVLDTGHAIEGIKGMLFSLHMVHPYIGSLLSMSGDGTTKRSSLQRVFYNATTHVEQLDQELLNLSSYGPQDRQRARASRNVRRLCRSCIIAYHQVGGLLMQSVVQLIERGDQRYIRSLLLLLYGSTIEGVNALTNLQRALLPAQPPTNTLTAKPETNRNGTRHLANGKDAAGPSRRYRSDTLNSIPSQVDAMYHMRPQVNTRPVPHSAVPLSMNGRTRSNSRTAPSTVPSTTTSVANTPRSGESFQLPSMLPGDGTEDPSSRVDMQFERIFSDFSSGVARGLTAIPKLITQITQRLEELALSKQPSRDLHDLWNRLIARATYCLKMAHALRARLATVKLKDPDVRWSVDFWQRVVTFANSFLDLGNELKWAHEGFRAQMQALDALQTLRPAHVCISRAVRLLQESPWSHVLQSQPMLPANSSLPAPSWSAGNAPHHSNGNSTSTNGSGPATASTAATSVSFGSNGSIGPNSAAASTFSGAHGVAARPGNAQHRAGQSSGSASVASSIVTYLPATPLSAALGPAAQATVPVNAALPPTSAFDRSFHGDVFQRAESLLSMQQTILLRR